MKYSDIKSYEIGESCFDEILRVNGIDYEDLSKEDIMEFINDMFNSLNGHIYIKETFKTLLENVEGDLVEHNNSSCDQCGNHNTYYKYEVKDV